MPEIQVYFGDREVSRYSFDKDAVTIGRSRDNDIVVENMAVSRNHARIVRQEDGKFVLTDLNSANGSLVNGVQVSKTELVNGDAIVIGKHRLLFENKALGNDALIGEAFGGDRTMIVDQALEAQLVIVKGRQKGEEFRISKTETSIGRAADNDIRLSDWFISRHHATIVRQGPIYMVKDKGSWKGTLVNDEHVSESPLASDDVIKMGTTVLEFSLVLEGGPPPSAGRVPVELSPGAEPVAAEPVDAPPVGAAPIVDESFEPPEPAEASGEMEDILPPKASDFVDVGAIVLPESEPESEPEPEPEQESEPEPEPEPVFEVALGADAALVSDADVPEPEQTPAPSEEAAAPEDVSPDVVLWERALENDSLVVRKEALRMLKKLTGRDYDA